MTRELWLTTLAGAAMARDVEPVDALAIAAKALEEYPGPTEADLLGLLTYVRDEANARVWGAQYAAGIVG